MKLTGCDQKRWNILTRIPRQFDDVVATETNINTLGVLFRRWCFKCPYLLLLWVIGKLMMILK